jgi:hypothetical protein
MTVPGHNEVVPLLGQQVVVLLARKGDRQDITRNIVSEGQLLGFGDGGDVEVLEDDGFVHHCWPMLEIRTRQVDPLCKKDVGTRPYWMGVDQYDACPCLLPKGHDGGCVCKHSPPESIPKLGEST